jgi:type IV pilus assembly protein PilB
VQPHELHKDEINALQLTEDEMKDMQPMLGTGCKACDDSGYKGRMGLFEVLEMEDQLARMVIEERPINEFRDYAVEHGHMRTLRHDGVKKVTSGMTSVAEVMRVTASDEH